MPKIVLVEDDQMLAEIYQTAIELEEFECHTAPDGMVGLALIQQELPDLVLLDLMLPQLSGDEVLRHMRESEWGKDIKVIILTNISESEAPPELEKYGFERYLVKANNSPQSVMQIVKETLGLTQGPINPEQQVA